MSQVTKITFPGNGPGEVCIRVYLDGKLSGPAMVVGAAYWDKHAWDVRLWANLNGPPFPSDEKLRARTLTGLRAALLERIRVSGKWWS